MREQILGDRTVRRMVFAAALAFFALVMCSEHAPAGADPANIDRFDRYYDAALQVERGRLDQGLRTLRELAGEGFDPAADLVALQDWSLARRTGVAGGPPPDIAARLTAAWQDTSGVPPGSAGNGISFSALQIVPRAQDAPLLEWIAARRDRLPPPVALEAARRFAATDTTAAMDWYIMGLLRIRYEILRCGDRSLGDLATLWGELGGGTLRKRLAPEQLKAAYLAGLKRARAAFERAVPVAMPVWQTCRGNEPALIGAPLPTDGWRRAHEALRGQVDETIVKADAAQ